MKCCCCGHSDFGEVISVKEMMYGWQEWFNYRACVNCGTLQLEQIPANLGKYYPNDYYSFASNKELPNFSDLKKKLIKIRDLAFYGIRNSIAGKLLKYIFPLTETEIQFKGYQFAYSIWQQYPEGKLLDIGSGNGSIVRYMQSIGFHGLVGLDPFVDNSTYHNTRPVIIKGDIFGWNEPVDAIMMNHSFEHMLEPKAVMAKISSVLKPGGSCMVRLPVRGGGYDRYGADWLCFDAPRHLFLTTEKGMKALLEGTNLELLRTEYETPAYYALGSELIKKGFSFNRMAEVDTLLNASEIAEVKAFTHSINAQKRGDAAAFYLRKKS